MPEVMSISASRTNQDLDLEWAIGAAESQRGTGYKLLSDSMDTNPAPVELTLTI